MAIYEPVQIPITSQPGQVWAGVNGSPPVLLVNIDANNTVYVGYQSNVSSNMPNTIPIGPFASVTMDGSRTIYAVGSNVTAPLTVIPGGSSYSPGSLNVQGNLNATVTGTVDINTPSPINVSAATVNVSNVNDDISLLNLSSQNILGGATYTSSLLAVNQSSYGIAIGALVQNTATNPFLNIYFHWVDANLFTIDTDNWIMPAASNGAFNVSGKGPTKAAFLQVKIINLDPAATIQVSAALWQSARNYIKDDWRWLNVANQGLTVPTFTLPTLPSDETNLGVISNVNVPAGGNTPFLCGMYNGPIQIGYGTNNAVPGSNQALIVTQVPASVYTAGAILIDVNSPLSTQTIFGGRAPLAVDVINHGSVAETASFNLVANHLP